MAGSRKGNRGSGKRSGSKRGPARKDAGAGRPAAEYAREAMTEWGKAVRHAASALRPARGPRLKQLLAASSKLGGGRIAGRRRASIVLPTPGGPIMSRL